MRPSLTKNHLNSLLRLALVNIQKTKVKALHNYGDSSQKTMHHCRASNKDYSTRGYIIILSPQTGNSVEVTIAWSTCELTCRVSSQCSMRNGRVPMPAFAFSSPRPGEPFDIKTITINIAPDCPTIPTMGYLRI